MGPVSWYPHWSMVGWNVEWPWSGLSVAATNKFEESETLSKAKDGENGGETVQKHRGEVRIQLERLERIEWRCNPKFKSSNVSSSIIRCTVCIVFYVCECYVYLYHFVLLAGSDMQRFCFIRQAVQPPPKVSERSCWRRCLLRCQFNNQNGWNPMIPNTRKPCGGELS